MAYHVFISYRRQGASELALLLYNRLSTDGYHPFLDMESMRSGRFNTQLFDRINECSDVIVLLPENALNRSSDEEDWLQIEIAYALKNGKNVIPVFMRNFTWPAQMPQNLTDLRYRQGIEATLEYFDAVYERLCCLISYQPKKHKIIHLCKQAALLTTTAIVTVFLAGFIAAKVQNLPIFSERFAPDVLPIIQAADNASTENTSTPLTSISPTPRPMLTTSADCVLQPYQISFGDEIAIRLLSDGNIDITTEAFEQAEWDDFKQNGYWWATKYTDTEYKSHLKNIVSSFPEMQQSRDYIDVSAAHSGILAAVHADGTVAFSKQAEWQYGLSADSVMWNDIKDIELGSYTILALKNDGSIVCHGATGSYAYKKGTLPWRWEDVVALSNDHIALGLRSDGRVYYADWGREPDDSDSYIDLDVISSWTDIVQIDTSSDSAVGLKADGTVVFAGDNHENKCDTSSWTDIIKVAVSLNHTVGLKKDGTLVSTKDWALKGGENLTGVVDVYVNRHNTLVILEDGTCRLLGESPDAEMYSGSWEAEQWYFPSESVKE